MVRRQAPRMEQISRSEQLQRVATMGILGGVAMFASGGSAKYVSSTLSHIYIRPSCL